MEYINFDLLVDKWGQQYKARVLDSPVGQASCILSLPFTSKEAKELNRLLVDPRVQKMGFEVAKQLGTRLFNALLANEVGICWHSSMQLASQQEKGLRLRLRLGDVPELAALPWEYLYIPSQDRFLSLSIETPIVRYLELPQKGLPLSTQAPLRILVVIASPLNAAPLNSDQEWKTLRQALSPLEQKGLVRLSRLRQGTLAGLRQQLRKQTYHIFHFIGHGAFNPQSEEGVLLLENDTKRVDPVSGQQLGILLRDHRSLRLALLNACQSAHVSDRNPFGGAAQRLVQQGIPAVIAMQLPIENKGAIAFASEFYAALADGYPVEAALSEGRKSLAEKDHLAWGIPVLYMRSPDGHLFEIGWTPPLDTNQSEIIEGIVRHLYQQPLGEKVSLTELLKVLANDEPQVVIDALSELESMDCIEMSVAAPTAMLCWLTHNGRKLAADFQRLADDSMSTAPPVISQPESKAIEQYPEFSWTLEGLDEEHAYVVQRQDLLECIQRILENPSDNRMAFLYGPPRVGKTFVLNRFKETLPDRYVPVLIHLNGWGSIEKLSSFLYELATKIKLSLESSPSRYQIEPFRPGSEREATIEFSNFMAPLVHRVRADGKLLLLIFDELEYLVSEKTDKQIFDCLANCIETYSKQQVRFVFAGSGDAVDFVQHGGIVKLWAKGQVVKIDCFDEQVSRDLMLTLTKRYFSLDTKALDIIIRLGNGQPTLLRSTWTVLFEYWKSKWRTNKITENELNDILEEIYIGLSGELGDIWSRLSLLEQRILQRIAQNSKSGQAPWRFREDEIAIENESDIGQSLKRLVRRQILHYASQDKRYMVRLGVIVELLSCGILSVSESYPKK